MMNTFRRLSLKSLLILLIAVVFSVHSSSNVLAVSESFQRENKMYWGNPIDPGELTCNSLAGTAGGAATVTNSVESFVDAYGQAAFDVGKASGIPYDAILAQAALESGYGQSGLTKEANNFFGIKAGSSWTGPTVTKRTAEQNAGGGVYYVEAKFRAYPDAKAGFQGYADFIRGNPRYAAALNYQHDPVGYITAVKNAGYATDVRYIQKVVNILNPVQQYIAGKNLFPPSSSVVYDVQPSGSATQGVSGGGNANCDATTAGGGSGSSVAEIAIREAQSWQTTPGYFKKYTQGRSENWCADFVSWVYKEAGRPFTATDGVVLSGGWQIPAVTNLRTYLQKKGQYWDKANAPPPQVGDIIIQKNGASHTNIVVEANGYMVKTVGGNEGGGGSQGSYFATSRVSMSRTAFDIRTYGPISGWGRLP